jgi:hypothetical protein
VVAGHRLSASAPLARKLHPLPAEESTMYRTILALAVVPVTLALVPACTHDAGERTSTTTIRSGIPGGVRAVPAEPHGDREYAARRLAAAICAHDRACEQSAQGNISPEAALLAEANCVAQVKPGAIEDVNAWECSPAVARAGFEECIAAISTQRCRDIVLQRARLVTACQPREVCRTGEGIVSR